MCLLAWESIMPAIIQKRNVPSALQVQTIGTVINKPANRCNCKATLIALEFLNVDISVPTTTDQLTSMDSPGPSSEHVVDEEEKNMEETRPVPARPPHKIAVMVLSLLDSLVSTSEADDKTMKVIDELQDFLSTSLKQRSIDSYFKTQ
jgi:hypothetical protein